MFDLHLQLLGEMSPLPGVFSHGILTRLLQEVLVSAHQRSQLIREDPGCVSVSEVKHWIVLEGPVDARVLAKLTDWLSSSSISLPNGQTIQLHSECVNHMMVTLPIILTIFTCMYYRALQVHYRGNSTAVIGSLLPVTLLCTAL